MKKSTRYWTSSAWMIDAPVECGKWVARVLTTRPAAILWLSILIPDVLLGSNVVTKLIEAQQMKNAAFTWIRGFPIELEVQDRVQHTSAGFSRFFGGAGKGIVNGDEDPARLAAENQDLMRRLEAGDFNGTKTPRKKGAKTASGASAPIQTGKFSEEALPGSTPYTRGLNAGMIPDAGEYVEALVDGVRQWIPKISGQKERTRERGKLLRQ